MISFAKIHDWGHADDESSELSTRTLFMEQSTKYPSKNFVMDTFDSVEVPDAETYGWVLISE